MTGPFVRREGPTRRFVYIRIGTSAGDHASVWSRRAKIDIHDIPPILLTPGAVLEAHLPGRGKDGSPACATVRRLGEWVGLERMEQTEIMTEFVRMVAGVLDARIDSDFADGGRDRRQ